MTHDRFWLSIADAFAQRSKDPSTKVGCVFVDIYGVQRSAGWNGFPRGIADTEDRLQNRQVKLSLTCHAEKNAIYNAALNGVSLRGCIAYITAPPCSACILALIQVGVGAIVFYKPDQGFVERWAEDLELSSVLLAEAGIPWREYERGFGHV